MRHISNGRVEVTMQFCSRREARRFKLFAALRLNPYGRRALDWLIRASEWSLPASRE
jgi:hypothetical protein